jgi:DNA-binding winged helix-turn-helix (wHTH) protein/tetratricopeptide (TPR) repeat protein
MKSYAIDTAPVSVARFKFGDFCLEPDGTLLRQRSPVHLPAKELAALRLLLQHAGHIVTPKQIRDTLWGNVHVTADSVPRCISSLRSRLEAEDRIQTIYKQGYRLTGAVEKDLASSGPCLPRLALVPFSCGPNVPEHIGQAVAADATAQLTATHSQIFSMLARDSVFALAARGMTAQQVGETLHADLVLTGTVHIVSMRFRLRMEMIRVEDGTQIWVEDVLVPRDRAAGLQLKLVEQLAFRTGVTIDEIPAPADDVCLDARAFDLFQRGRHEWYSTERHRMQDGVRYLHQAIELEPRLTQARADIVRATVAQELFGYVAPRTAAEHIQHIAEGVREDQETYRAILPSLGWMTFHVSRDLASAQRLFEMSREFPRDAWNTRICALFAASRRQFAEAGALLRKALEQDPYSPWLNAELAWICHLAGKREESVRQVGRCLELAPHHTATRLLGGAILAFNGESAHAIALTGELAQRTPYFDMAVGIHAYALACHGDRKAAGEWLERLQWMSHERYVMRSISAASYLALGDRDGAMAELQAADEDRCPWFFAMLADPRLRGLHDVAEFQAMRTRLEDMETAPAPVPPEVPVRLGATK